MKKSISPKNLDARSSVIKNLIVDGKVVYLGKDLPDTEDPSDPEFIAKVYISDTGTGTETIFGDKIIGTGIPSLVISDWNKESVSYLKHWLFKVLDDPVIYRANEIYIEAVGSWPKKFKR